MSDRLTADSFLKNLSIHDSVFDYQDEDFEYTEAQIIDFAERYHKHRVEAVTDDDIFNEFPSKDGESYSVTAENQAIINRRIGANWMKSQLLQSNDTKTE